MDGSREAPLVLGKTKNTSPVWTPDGQRVVFLSDRSGTQDLWSVRVADGKAEGEPELLRASMGDITNMGFTRDGSYFYGTGNQRGTCYMSASSIRQTPDARPPHSGLRQADRANAGGAWSPDGRIHRVLPWRRSPAMSLVSARSMAVTERTLPTALSDSIIAQLYGSCGCPTAVHSCCRKSTTATTSPRSGRSTSRAGSDQVLVEGSDIWPVARVSPDGETLYFTRVEKGEKPDTTVLHLIARDLAEGTETELYSTVSSGVGFFG